MGKDSSNSFALVLALLAVFSGSWLYLGSRPLESERPSQQAADHQDATRGAMVRARLWQDPLQPIQQHWNGITSYIAENGSTPPGATLPSTIAQFANELARFDGKRLRLVVLTPGGPYADDIEQRSRHRYAIVSALTEADFVPRDGEHIGYFVAPSFNLPDDLVDDYRACQDTGDDSHKCFLGEAHVTIGYEFFVSSRERNRSLSPSRAEKADASSEADKPSDEEGAFNPDWKSVVVFWVNEDDIAAAPLNAIDALMAAVDRPNKGMSERATVVIGPSNSSVLQAMYLSANRETSAYAAEFVKEADTYGDDFQTLVFDGKRARAAIGSGNFDPDPVFETVTDAFVERVDGYLDYGLPPDEYDSLSTCLNGETAFKECIDKLPYIEDSDPEWREAVKGFWDAEPHEVEAMIESAAGQDADIQSLLLAANDYLDRGLPKLSSLDELGGCLRTSRGNGARLSDRVAIATCLKGLSIIDSDEDWVQSVADDWVGRNPVGESDGIPVMSDASIDEALAQERKKLVILSPRATAPLDFLLGDDRFAVASPDEESREGVDDELTASLGISRFRSIIERDDLVVRNVLVELDARGACDQADPTIAVVSEQDSPYGRFVDDVIREQANRLYENGIAHREGRTEFPRAERVSCRFEVQEFGYLRGVDGELPPGTTSPERSPLTPEDAAAATDPATLGQVSREQAVGAAQLDYVRRLADTIARKRLEGAGANFVAIGILGSDVYDKRLILQSLRERLPWVTFFTTDLDARLSDADALRWTKNLLVASAYSNVLAEREGAAFRDVYQTSIYRAVQLALSISSDEDITGKQVTAATIPGAEPSKLFEISRSGPVELPSAGSAASGKDETRLWTPDPRSAAAGVLLLLPLLGLAIGAWMLCRQISTNGQEDLRWTLTTSAWLAFFAAALLAGMLSVWNRFFDEPWLLFEGISSVPTLVLHLTTAVFAVCLMLMTLGRIVQGNRDVADEFNLPKRDALKELLKNYPLFPSWMKPLGKRKQNEGTIQEPKQEASAKLEKRPLLLISTWTKELSPLKRKQKKRDVQDIWLTYLTLNRSRARILRIAVPVIVWSAVAMYIFRVDPTPMLSHDMHGILGTVRDFTVVLVLATVFYCTDALCLGQLLVRSLARHDVGGWNNQNERSGKAGPKAPFDDYTWRRKQTIHLIVATTEIIGPVVVFPFVLMFLLIVARNPLFEGWVWSTNLLLFYVGFGGHIVVRALRFQFEAANARDEIRRDLEANRYNVTDEDHAENLGFAIAEIEGIDRGAFVPWTRHPILQSLALPSSGLGLISIANAFLQ
jgi:hypothetical protein